MLRGLLKFLFFLLFPFLLYSQSPDGFKNEALNLMKIGKYGEAIEQLNKFVSARPQSAEGFYLRAQCYEARGQLEAAVFDYRVARRIAPGDKNIIKACDLATIKWYNILEDKISGHKREIAIDPSIPSNYLQIALCYKHMMKWSESEQWYEAYMKKEEASADEILRYTEVLIKLGKFDKGEKISRVYNGKYPRDIRMWSRNGWFNVWLGRYKPAAESFKKALEIRPFFKEAMEGLEIAEGRPYIYTYYDTTKVNKEEEEKKKQQEYIIDKYYRLLKVNPADDEMRFQLVIELQNVRRFEEAFQQLQILSDNYSGTERYDSLWNYVTVIRDSIYAKEIEDMTARFDANPADTVATMTLAESYFKLGDFDSAIEIFERHIAAYPNTTETIRFNFAKYLAYNQQFEPAIEQMNMLLVRRPDDLDYQLLRSQIAVWTTQDLDLAKKYLFNILNTRPDNLQAIVALTTVFVKERNFDEALNYLNKAKSLAPDSREVETVQNYYDSNLELEEDRKNFDILVEARELAVDQRCEEAIEKYDEYFSRVSSPSRFELIEYADVNICARNFDEAKSVYDRLLNNEYDYDIALQRAKVYLWSGDSITAKDELTKLVEEDTSSFEARFYLAETYERLEEYDMAEEYYTKLLESTQDTARISLLKLRIGWLPKGGPGIFSNFPLFIRLAPQMNYFGDNQGFSFFSLGGQVEVGINSFLSVGLTFTRSTLDSNLLSNIFTTFKWNLYLYLTSKVVIVAGQGNLSYLNQIPVKKRKNVQDLMIRYIDNEKLVAGVSYETNEAAMHMFSSKLIYYDLSSELYKFDVKYLPNSLVRLTGNFAYLSLGDGNEGNNVTATAGRYFYPDILAGYEYQYSNFNRSSTLYYSPLGFEAHIAFGEWYMEPYEKTKVMLGAKLGYIPESDSYLREISGSAEYKPYENFIVAVRATAGGSFRYDAGYRYYSLFASAFWSF